MKYYLGPYQWIDNCWKPPSVVIGAIDLRNLSQMGTPVVQDGFGFFATNDPIIGYDLLGEGDLREINSTGAMKSIWNSLLGYNPNGDKLVDLLYDHLTMGSDPIGAAASKPLMPDRGNLVLHLRGHSPIKSIQFRIGHSKESNQVISVIQEDYRKIYKEVTGGKLPIDMHRKVLGYLGKQFKIKTPQDIFIPNDLPKETPLDPSTSFSENFDGADNAILGKQLTWVEGEDTTSWENKNNRAQRAGIDNSPTVRQSARCTSAVSSADHFTIATVPTFGPADAGVKNTQGGTTARHSSSADDAYIFNILQFTGAGDGPSDQFATGKLVAGVASSIGTHNEAIALPLTTKGEVSGSTIKQFINNVLKNSDTDTAITGNLFGGLWGLDTNTNSNVEIDNWSIDDEVITLSIGGSFLLGLI